MYWNVRWEPSPIPALSHDNSEDPSTMVIYKESQASYKIDPDPDHWTGTFRDVRKFNPEGSRPENAVTGTIFTVNAWRNDPLIVPSRYSKNKLWRNTPVISHLKENEKAILLKGILGHEWDEDLDNGYRPAG